MKTLLISLLTIFLLIGCTVSMKPNGYETERRNIKREYIYDSQGHYQGYVEKSDNGTTFYYDKDGRLKGYSTK